MKKILVTGAGGRVGRHVARRLVAENVSMRLLFRSAPLPGAPAHAEVVKGDYNEPAQMAKAFASVDAIFMYAPDAHASEGVFAAAREAGVRQVVLVSSASVTKAAPGTNPIAERHRIAEAAIQAAGLDWTFIRPDTMASNCLQWAPDIRGENCVYTPYPESMRSAVHEDDIALLAVQALLGGKHIGRAYEVTGGELLRIREQVHCIATKLDTAVQCIAISPGEALQRMSLAQPGLSPQGAARLLEYLRKSTTVAPRITDDYAQATGRAPRSFSEWVAGNLDHFRRHPSTASGSQAMKT